MRRVDLARPGAPSGDRARVARLTRHLKARLERDWGVTVLQDGEDAVFRLAPSVRFEDLDYVWGALFEVLG